MRRSSLGFHTFTISRPLFIDAADELYEDFRKYGKKTGEVRIRPDKIKNDADDFGSHFIIEYPNRRKGLSWSIRIGKNEYTSSNVKATINPKIFTGENDYITAANNKYMKTVESLFNEEAKKISEYLYPFEKYSLTRCDYCLNIDVVELELPCTPKQMMKLIKRADVPVHYRERTEYNARLHRQQPDSSTFYLQSKSAVVNYYHKNAQLLSEYPNCPSIDDSRDVIRFEIQYRYPKMYAVSKILKEKQSLNQTEMVSELLSDSYCSDVIRTYYDRIIRKGNYLTLDGARWMVEARGYKRKKEERLINTLELVNKCRGISKAKEQLKGYELEDFRRSLRELDEILVNPVTIPREWKIEYIKNPLQAYYDSACDERLIFGNEKKFEELLDEYMS